MADSHSGPRERRGIDFALALRHIRKSNATINLPSRCGASHNVEWRERTDCSCWSKSYPAERDNKRATGSNGGAGPPINWRVRLPGASQGLDAGMAGEGRRDLKNSRPGLRLTVAARRRTGTMA